MSTIKKPDYTIFAEGAKSDELQPFPNISRGWGITLEQTAGMPPLEWANYIQKRTDEWLMYLTQNGLAEWDESLDYSKGALSQVDGVIYRAKEAVKGESPTTSVKWERLFADEVGGSNFIGMSQSAITKELNKKISGKITGSQSSGTNEIWSANASYEERNRLDKKIDEHGLGFNQSVKNVTSSRKKGVLYTNSTKNTIFVSIAVLVEKEGIIELQVGDEGVASHGISPYQGSYSTVRSQLCFPVVSGLSYKLVDKQGVNTIISWAEVS